MKIENLELDDKVEKKCKCGNKATAPHPCPYMSDVHNDNETLCTCCEECEQECANDT